MSFGCTTGQIVSVTTRAVPDYAVVPIMGYPVERTVNEIVTNAFVVSARELLHYNECHNKTLMTCMYVCALDWLTCTHMIIIYGYKN